MIGAVPPRVSVDRCRELGAEYARQGRTDECLRHYRRAAELAPDSWEIAAELGSALLRQCKVERVTALAVATAGVNGAARPEKADAEAAIKELRLLLAACKWLRRAIALGGATGQVHADLGNALLLLGKLEEAGEQFRLASTLDPDDEGALRSLANVLLVGGFVDEALGHIRAILRARPGASRVHSAYLLGLHYRDALRPEHLFEEHRRFQTQHAEGLMASPPLDRARPGPNRRLRIGYVSPDLRRHSVAYFFEPVIQAHRRDEFEVVCYASLPRPDFVTERLQRLADEWRDVHAMTDGELAELVRRDQIDILVDLAGHTLGNRLLAFARKPAPVQVTYLGYPDTTGLVAMDYRLTDGWADPEGWTEHLHSEQLIRLSSGFSCYRPPEQAPPVGSSPARERGGITFGSFNNLCKVTPEIVARWAGILAAVPGSRLVMKASALGNSEVRRHIQGWFRACDIEPNRLVLMGEMPSVADHLALYGEIDVALDTFPYHGTTTTCEALWMGVPVISQAGRTHTSRVGVSLLTRAGLPELIAPSGEAYVELAVRLANDRERLSELRRTMRSRLRHSPLMDAAAVTSAIEGAYRRMWQTWLCGSR